MIKLRFLLYLIILSATQIIFSQAPQSFKYQAMARNANGEIMVNQSVSILIEIMRGTATVYTETHKLITNQFGLINLEIGRGNQANRDFSDINWSLGDHYIAVSIDPEGGTNYLSVGTAQLLSVPYALYANNSADSYWDNIQTNLNYRLGKVMIGNSEFLGATTGDLNSIPALSIEGGFWAKMPRNISTVDIDNMNLNNNSIGTGLPLGGLYSIYDADYHLRGYWGVNIDRNGGNASYDHPIYKGLNADAGSFAVRYRISPTAFRTDLIVNGQGNVGIGTTAPERKLSLVDSIFSFEDGNKRIFLELNNKSIDNGSEVEINLKAGSNGTITKLLKYSDTYDLYPGEEVANYGMFSDDGSGIILRAWANDGNIVFKTAHVGPNGHGIERMRIDSQGRAGIGVTNPQRTLHISDVMRIEPTLTAPSSPAEGDIYMDATTHKLMVFDGTIWQACW